MRAIVFVDYWNVQLTLQHEDAKALSVDTNNHRFNIDWFNLGLWITKKVEDFLKETDPQITISHQETRVYTSTNPNDNGRYKQWAINILGKKPGIRVFCLDRKEKKNQNCSCCYKPVDQCPHCKEKIVETQEKGVDTLLVTDLLSLGLDKSYDVAILISQDSDMKPAVEHLANKGIKVVHVGIKHFGSDLAKSCWATYNAFPYRDEIKRPT